jgi:hypothetical protein
LDLPIPYPGLAARQDAVIVKCGASVRFWTTPRLPGLRSGEETSMLEDLKISFARPLCLLTFGLVVSSSLSGVVHASQSAPVERLRGLQAPVVSPDTGRVITLDLSKTSSRSVTPGAPRLDAEFIDGLQLGDTLLFTAPKARLAKRSEVLRLKVHTRRILGNQRVAIVLKDVDGGDAHAQFVLRNDAVAAALHTGDGAWWRLTEAPGFAMLVEPMTSDDLPLCEGATRNPNQVGEISDLLDPADSLRDSTEGSLAGDGPPLGSLCSGGCSSTTIDLAIFYTQNTVIGTGSPLIVEAICELAVVQANTSFENSDSTTRVRIVYLGQVDYDDSVESGHLNHLADPEDGYMDEVQGIMQAAGADAASLIVEYGEGWCGVAYLFNPFGPQYHANSRFCLGGFVLAHELGHNLGACHAVGDGGGCENGGVFGFSNGWRFNGDSGNQYRTIMAYTPGTRIPHFSNPSILYQGQPTGDEIVEVSKDEFVGADNITTMNIVTPFAAEWACVSAASSTVKILPSNPVELDLFGTVIALENGQPIIGSYLSDEGDENTGATYLYRASNPELDGLCDPNPYTGFTPETCWIQDGKAPILESRPVDGMGKSVSAQNGLLVSGAPFRDLYELEENDATGEEEPVLQNENCGAIFLHASDGETSWCLAQEIYSEEPTDEFRFGNVVATDGTTVAATSERYEEISGTTFFNGSVELFSYDPSFDNGKDANGEPLPPGAWAFDQRLQRDGNLTSQLVGYGDVLAISGTHLAVGAPDSASARGLVVMYERVGDDWVFLEELSKNLGADALYGASVSISGERMIIGAPGSDDGDGLIFVYEFNGSEWVEVWTIGPLLGDEGAAFGSSVAIDGDRLVIGAPLSDISEVVDSGAVFLAKKVEELWFIVDQIYAFDGETSDQYGMSVALEGDLVLVGAGYDNDNGIQSGSAYVYPFAPLFDCNFNGYGDEYEIAQNISEDNNGNGVPDPCDCSGDLNFDGLVDGTDLTLLLNNWGQTGSMVLGDINRDGVVNGADITSVLIFWGICEL